MDNNFIIRATFYGEQPIHIPIYNKEKELIIDCKTKMHLRCIVKYRRNIIYSIDWEGLHQKTKETFSYRTLNGKKHIYVSKNYYRGLGTTTEKELVMIL